MRHFPTSRIPRSRALFALAMLLAGLAPPAPGQQITLVRNIGAGPGDPGPTGLTDFGGALYFFASDGVIGRELWRTDGRPSATFIIKDIAPGPSGSAPRGLTRLGAFMLFSANDGMNGQELWRTDGTGAGTVMLRDIFPGGNLVLPSSSQPSSFTVAGGELFFSASSLNVGRELWKTNGFLPGTVLVRDIRPGTQSSMVIGSNEILAIGSTLFFAADAGGTGLELWRSDGSEAGTALVLDIEPGSDPSFRDGAAGFTEFEGNLFFEAFSTGPGQEAWRSDGTPAGTMLLDNITPGSLIGPGGPSQFTPAGSMLFFVYNDGGAVFGSELWVTGGSPGEAAMVRDIQPGMGFGAPDQLTDGSGVAGSPVLFFSADDGVHGAELWMSDGTTSGTIMLKDINSGPEGSSIGALTALGDRLYFAADDGATGRELWISDGSAAGTRLLADLNPGEFGSNPADFTASGSRVFFVANDGSTGTELYALRLDPPEIRVDTSPLAFGSREVGAGPSPARTVLIHNDGTGELPFVGAGISLGGAGAGEFAFVAPPDVSPLPPGESRAVQVVFEPASPGFKNATLRITSDDDDESNLSITLTGNGTAPDLEAEFDPFIFFRRQIDEGPSLPEVITLRNFGDAPLRFIGPGVEFAGPGAADFGLAGLFDPAAVLAPGASMELLVFFDPASTGFKDADLVITTSDLAEPVVTIPLVGFGFEFSAARHWTRYR